MNDQRNIIVPAVKQMIRHDFTNRLPDGTLAKSNVYVTPCQSPQCDLASADTDGWVKFSLSPTGDRYELDDGQPVTMYGITLAFCSYGHAAQWMNAVRVTL